jgi:hypothetical protein
VRKPLKRLNLGFAANLAGRVRTVVFKSADITVGWLLRRECLGWRLRSPFLMIRDHCHLSNRHRILGRRVYWNKQANCPCCGTAPVESNSMTLPAGRSFLSRNGRANGFHE